MVDFRSLQYLFYIELWFMANFVEGQRTRHDVVRTSRYRHGSLDVGDHRHPPAAAAPLTPVHPYLEACATQPVDALASLTVACQPEALEQVIGDILQAGIVWQARVLGIQR
ncbi:hypothetical protein C8E86_6038 [Catellatospora citrea]|nr:hypothetical protein C8E86_6038 [Catellatospora citrea]